MWFSITKIAKKYVQYKSSGWWMYGDKGSFRTADRNKKYLKL
jgi:hypothetical protein